MKDRNHDIEEDEIRVIGNGSSNDGTKRFPQWLWLVLAAVAFVAVVFIIAKIRTSSNENTVDPDKNPEVDNIWFDNTDASLPSCIVVNDTLIDSIHLHIYTPYNTIPELHVGALDTTDNDILFATLAADVRRDNGKIVGAFVYAGEPLSWGLSKQGYCAIIDGRIALGVAENSPLFEQATEQHGYFFRQYPSVDNGVMVKNNPENASFRRALCLLDHKICIVISSDRVLMNDFSASLVKLGVRDAILLVGGTSDGWVRTESDGFVRLGSSIAKQRDNISYLVFRRQ